MSYGLDATGFSTKSLAVIKTELETAFRSAFGAGIKTAPDTIFGKMIDVLADRESSLWELSEAVYNAFYPDSASDISLSRLGEITGISPNAATKSAATLYLGGTASTVVPSGTLIAVQDAGDQFTLDADVTLVLSSKSVVAITRVGGVVSVNAVGHGLVAGQRVYHSGSDQDDYNGLSQVTTVVDADNYEFTIATTPTTPATGTINALPMYAGAATAVETGPVAALADTLTEIVNYVSGWDQVTNEEDATPGANAESDAAFRTRRIAALQGLGGARIEAIRGNLLTIDGVSQAIVFENITNETDVDNRPAHSIECLVVGGVNADILQSIFDSKAAGIESYGDVSGSVTDSQSINHTISFSRPGSVTIYLEVDLTTNADFPANGVALAEAALLAFGDGLGIGEDVVVYPSLMSSLDGIVGITDVAIRVGTAIGPTLDNNISINDTDIADFDSSRITVTELP